MSKELESLPDTPYDLIKSVDEHWNAHDLEFVYELLDEDYCEYFNGVLVKQGRAAARAADQLIYDAVPDYRREIDELYADRSGCAMRWRFCGTGPNGRFEVSVASTYRIEDGRIVECWVYGDPAAYAHALGIAQ
jgi:ketosteroid isomerase-like protein